jgi:hypothetical protein
MRSSRNPKQGRARAPKKQGPAETAPALVDNRTFFDSEGAAAQLKTSQENIFKLSQRGMLAPGRLEDGSLVFTLADLERYRRREGEKHREKLIFERLRAGAHPLDVFLELEPDGVKLAHVWRVLQQYSKLGGLWVIEGPPGSYARWLERVGLARLTPRNLRRLVELLLSDAPTAQRVGAWVSASDRVSARAEAPEDLPLVQPSSVSR